MFNLFNKKYISCEELEYGIHFDTSGLYHCCCYFHSNANYTPIAPIKGNIEENFKQFISIKKHDKLSHKKGKIINRCKGCFLLEKREWKKSDKIRKIAISANKKCNSDCIYCTTHIRKNYYNSTEDTPIYDFIKKLYNNNLIEKNCDVQFGGGEPTLHFEFEKLMKFFIYELNAQLRIHTSGIKYCIAIEDAIKLSHCHIVISLDSGNKELYKTIKNVDEFENVINNIIKYSKAQSISNEPSQIELKYIIIPNVNDSEEQIMEFLNLAKKIGVKAVRCDIENNWFKKYKNNIEILKPYLYLMKFFDKKAKELDLWQFFNDVPLDLIKNYNNEYQCINL